MMKYIIKKFAQYFKNETFEVNEDLSNLSSVLNRHLTSYKDEVGDLNIQVKKINDVISRNFLRRVSAKTNIGCTKNNFIIYTLSVVV